MLESEHAHTGNLQTFQCSQMIPIVVLVNDVQRRTWVVRPNVGGKLAPTVGCAGRVGENVQRTAYLARVARRWCSA